MGKDKKAKKAEQKARTAAKQSKKAAKGEKKAKAKAGQDNDSDVEDVDLDAVLASYAEQQAQFLKVTESVTDPPSPRSSSTFLASPSNRNELFVFGGEYYNGTTAIFYNNLFVYLIDRGEWREITSPNSPLPRSGHAWCRGGNQGGIYMFGGEFSSPKQGTFYHYNDFWHLDTGSREWTRLEVKGKSPPARSGHRMTHYKNYILLFGGFQDTSQQTKYLQDLWIYDSSNFIWHNPGFSAVAQKPDPRSSCSFLPHESGAVLCGGYSRVKVTAGSGKQAKGGPQRNVLKPCIHQDTWYLRLTPPSGDATASFPPTVRWERRKRPVNSPNPARAGVTMAYHKGRGIYFGGVHDVEESEEGIDSEFFNALFAWNIDRNRFFQLNLRHPKQARKHQNISSTRGRNRGKADEEELLRNLARLETKGSADVPVDDILDMDAGNSSEEVEQKFSPPVRFEMPHPRFNTQMTVQEDVLFLFGGTFERADHEFTFTDMYSIDLGKMDGVKELYSKEPENWNAQTDDESDEGEYNEEEEDSDEEMQEEYDSTFEPVSNATTEQPVETDGTSPVAITAPADDEEPENEMKDDPRPYPRPFESLKDFFSRTSTEWQGLVMEKLKIVNSNAASALAVKEIRKTAFDMADERWWDCREEIQVLEEEQEEAGIGEIISIKDRGVDNAGPGRRR
ncbi:MAG: hypothetical protein Q9227_002080 [Pyrenula ochraceoflavens]